MTQNSERTTNKMLRTGIPRGKNVRLCGVFVDKADARTVVDANSRNPAFANLEFFLITFDGYYEVWQKDKED